MVDPILKKPHRFSKWLIDRSGLLQKPLKKRKKRIGFTKEFWLRLDNRGFNVLKRIIFLFLIFIKLNHHCKHQIADLWNVLNSRKFWRSDQHEELVGLVHEEGLPRRVSSALLHHRSGKSESFSRIYFSRILIKEFWI